MWTAETLAVRYGTLDVWATGLIRGINLGILTTADEGAMLQRIAQCADWATAAQIHNELVAENEM